MRHRHKHLRTVADSVQTSQRFPVTLWKTKVQGQEISAVVTCPDMVFRWAFSFPHPKSDSGRWPSTYAISLWLPRSATKKFGRSVLIHSECYLLFCKHEQQALQQYCQYHLVRSSSHSYAGQWTHREVQTDYSIMQKWQCDPFHSDTPSLLHIIILLSVSLKVQRWIPVLFTAPTLLPWIFVLLMPQPTALCCKGAPLCIHGTWQAGRSLPS